MKTCVSNLIAPATLRSKHDDSLDGTFRTAISHNTPSATIRPKAGLSSPCDNGSIEIVYHHLVSTDPLLQPVLLTSAPTEFAAQTIVHALSEEGIKAWSLGGMPMEAASFAKVMVLRADLELARAVLEVIRSEAQAIDWNAMDEAELGVLSPEDEAIMQRRRRHAPFAGIAVTGLGAVALAGHRTMFQSLPPAAKPVPGSVLIVTGLILCYAAGRTRGGSR